MLINKSEQVYCLIDCDSFYASCEIIRHPDREGKPIIVARERDIVLAASYEAKYHGIKTGSAHRDAKRILPNAIFVAPDFDRYTQVSDKLNIFLAEFTNKVEVFSIDESFCDITGLAEYYELDRHSFARKLKHTIKHRIGIPVSIGVARTKLLAKLFSDQNKPYGEFVALEQHIVDDVLAKTDIHDICFIGDTRTNKLKGYAISSALDLKQSDPRRIKKLLGVDGQKIWMELNGRDVMTFEHHIKPKSITRSRSFHPDFSNNKERLRHHLLGHFEKAYQIMLSHHLSTRYIKVRLRDRDFVSHSQDILLEKYCSDKKELLGYIRELFEGGFKSWVWYRTTGIVLGLLRDTTMYHEDDLFTYHHKQRYNKIYAAIDSLNSKFGKKLIGTASEYSISPYSTKRDSLESQIAFVV